MKSVSWKKSEKKITKKNMKLLNQKEKKNVYISRVHVSSSRVWSTWSTWRFLRNLMFVKNFCCMFMNTTTSTTAVQLSTSREKFHLIFFLPICFISVIAKTLFSNTFSTTSPIILLLSKSPRDFYSRAECSF